jgi:polyisoprenyl-phosphate glycosyltransferase
MPKYSLVIPIYNEESTIPALYQRVSTVMDRLDGSAELILVNDGSTDRTLELLRTLHDRDDRVIYLSLARNFGHQIAVTAGLNYVRGQAIIVLDADLQDPPELIPDLVSLWRQGYHVVYAHRTKRLQEGWFKRLCAYIFYRILRQLANVDIPTDTGDFCLMDRQVVDLLNRMPERDRYLRGLRAWVGFKQIALHFERDSRYAGTAKYTLIKSFALAINGIISFSIIPLRLSTYLGLFSAVVAIGMALLVLYWRMFTPNSTLTGFATIAIAIFFLGAVQLISIGILGEYIGRIYEEVKKRPLYTLAEISRRNRSGIKSGRSNLIPPDTSPTSDDKHPPYPE